MNPSIKSSFFAKDMFEDDAEQDNGIDEKCAVPLPREIW